MCCAVQEEGVNRQAVNLMAYKMIHGEQIVWHEMS